MSTRSRVCQVCLCSEVDAAFENTLAAVGGLDMSYSIGRCRKCGFHFANRMADDVTVAKYYGSLSKYDMATSVSVLDLARIRSAIRILEPLVAKTDSVVDLGCGFGAFLAHMRDAGWTDLYGVDPGPNAAQCAMELFGLDNIHCATLATADSVVPLAHADLVCVMAVLEHLPNLREDMQNLLSRLRSGCRVLIEVPALDLFRAQGAEPFGEFSLEHIQFFGATSLRNLFSSIGARTLAIETVALPMVQSGSLFGLFEKADGLCVAGDLQREDDAIFKAYVEGSKATLSEAMQRIPKAPLVIYGAGSHTARLIPALEKTHVPAILTIVDGNPNLIGKQMGRWTIQPPEALTRMPHASVLVSSFRSQNEIAANLAKQFANEVVLMYP